MCQAVVATHLNLLRFKWFWEENAEEKIVLPQVKNYSVLLQIIILHTLISLSLTLSISEGEQSHLKHLDQSGARPGEKTPLTKKVNEVETSRCEHYVKDDVINEEWKCIPLQLGTPQKLDSRGAV